MLDGEVADGRGSSPLRRGARDLLLARAAVAEERFFTLRQSVDLQNVET